MMTDAERAAQLERAVTTISEARLPTSGSAADWHEFLETVRKGCLLVVGVRKDLESAGAPATEP